MNPTKPEINHYVMWCYPTRFDQPGKPMAALALIVAVIRYGIGGRLNQGGKVGNWINKSA
jgi:hypothetical protein